MCDVWMCVCAHAHRHMCDTVHLWRSEDNLSIHPHPPLYYTGFFCCCCLWLCTTGSLAPEFEGFSYLGFPSHHRSTGIADVQHCTQIYMVLKV